MLHVVFIASEDVLLLPVQVIFFENALTSLASAGSEEHSLHVEDVRFKEGTAINDSLGDGLEQVLGGVLLHDRVGNQFIILIEVIL